jgi:hypothetical protein
MPSVTTHQQALQSAAMATIMTATVLVSRNVLSPFVIANSKLMVTVGRKRVFHSGSEVRYPRCPGKLHQKSTATVIFCSVNRGMSMIRPPPNCPAACSSRMRLVTLLRGLLDIRYSPERAFDLDERATGIAGLQSVADERGQVRLDSRIGQEIAMADKAAAA